MQSFADFSQSFADLCGILLKNLDNIFRKCSTMLIERWTFCFKYYEKKNTGSNVNNVPEVLNVQMNEIYKKLTTIKLNKFKFEKIFKKITFSFSKLNFLLLEKKTFLKKVNFLLLEKKNLSKKRSFFTAWKKKTFLKKVNFLLLEKKPF